MSLYAYLHAINPNLICCICRAPFTEPTTTLSCAHTFCRECIQRALSHAPLCPIDRLPLAEKDLVPADPIIRSLVEELEVECVHRFSGCKHTCQRQRLAAHIRDDCMFSQVECKETNCGIVLARKELEAHKREKHALSQNEPQIEGSTDTAEKDSNSTAGDKEPAPNMKGKQADGPAPPTIDDKKQDKTVELLTEQNILLRHRVELLEGAMQVMKKEMSMVRNALGPWFRMPTVSRSQSNRPHVPPRGEGNSFSSGVGLETVLVRSYDETQESSGSSSSVTNNSATSSHQPEATPLLGQGQGHRNSLSLPGGGVGHVRMDPLAGYFPTLNEFGIHGGGNMSQHMQHGLHGRYMQQHQQMLGSVSGLGGGGAQPGGSLLNPSAAARVAPLDLGLNIAGTLEGLRESVIEVAAGLDSLGRRSEIALANETLRLGEDVISVRAAVHGLRMQVHAMMMERNAHLTAGEDGGGGGSSWMGTNGIGFGLGVGNNSGNAPAVPPRPYMFTGPPSITKL